MLLTDPKVRQAKAADKMYRLNDGRGLYLLIKPNGGKYWRFNYRYGGKQKTLALGVYNNVSLKNARLARDKAKSVLVSGSDPAEIRRAQKVRHTNLTENSFQKVALEWFSKQEPIWSENHSIRVKRSLEKNLFPPLGNLAISDIVSIDVLGALRTIEARGAIETAHRAKQIAGQVFRYAVATGRAQNDPTSVLKGALAKPVKTHLAAITEPREVGKLLAAIDEYKGTFTVQNALKLAPLIFVRPGELRRMEVEELRLDIAEWHIPGKKMKMSNPHIVPLSKQALTIIKNQLGLTGNGRYVFPGARSIKRPMSNNALLVALRLMGIPREQMTVHGFRAMARTLLDEVLGFRVDLVEHQLAHAVRDALGRAYNRTTHLPKRKEMMQKWADYLDNLKAQALSKNVISHNFKRA